MDVHPEGPVETHRLDILLGAGHGNKGKQHACDNTALGAMPHVESCTCQTVTDPSLTVGCDDTNWLSMSTVHDSIPGTCAWRVRAWLRRIAT